MAVTITRKIQEQLRYIIHRDNGRNFPFTSKLKWASKILSRSIKEYQRYSAKIPCRRKSFPYSACHACLPCRYSLLPLWLLPATRYSWSALFRGSTACHRQLCSHFKWWFSFQPMYMSHFLLVLSKYRRALSSSTYIYPFLQSPSAAGAKPQLYCWSAPNTHCGLYYLHQRPSYKHISRRSMCRMIALLCANLYQQVYINWLTIPHCTMDKCIFTLDFGLCVKVHIMLLFGSE